jgi:hypothetical protein
MRKPNDRVEQWVNGFFDRIRQDPEGFVASYRVEDRDIARDHVHFVEQMDFLMGGPARLVRKVEAAGGPDEE